MINTTDNLLKKSQCEERELIAELLFLADSLELDGQLSESQLVDDFIIDIKDGAMEKDAGIRDMRDVAEFIKSLLKGKNPRMRRRLRQINKREETPPVYNPPTVQEKLYKQWNIDEDTVPLGKDYTGGILGKYFPGVLPKATMPENYPFKKK